MNQLNEKIQYRHKGKVGLGYIEEGESSQQGAKKKKRPTCNHCGKIGHTSKKFQSNGKEKLNGKWYSCNKHGHRESECKEKPKFKGKCHNCKEKRHKSSECKTKQNKL